MYLYDKFEQQMSKNCYHPILFMYKQLSIFHLKHDSINLL